MINVPHYQPCMVTPVCVNGIEGVLLEDGKIAVRARLLEGVHLGYNFPCLAIVDSEELSDHVVITDLNVIAANVNVIQMRQWLVMLDDDLIGYFVEVIGLINQMEDKYLQLRLFDAIFNEWLHPSNSFSQQVPLDLASFYQLILATGELVWQQCSGCHLSQYEIDSILARNILQEIAKFKCIDVVN